MTTAERQSSLLVPLRPSSETAWAVVLCAFFGMLFVLPFILVFPPPSKPLPPLLTYLSASLSVAGLTPALIFAFYCSHARLLVSETGLKWRTWGDWRRVSWNGVQDYYDLPPRNDGSGKGRMALETDQGKIILSRCWRESEAVRVRVQELANNANTEEWGVLGQRSCVGDARTFFYPQGDFWGITLFGGGVILPMTLRLYYMFLPPKGRSFWGMLTQGWQPGDFWGSLLSTGFLWIILFGGIVLFSLPLLVFVANIAPAVDRRQRRHQSITTRQSGISFQDGRRRIEANWDEITSFYLKPSAASYSAFFRATAFSSSRQSKWRWVWVIETNQGTFDYSFQIEGLEQLGLFIRNHAIPLDRREYPTRK